MIIIKNMLKNLIRRCTKPHYNEALRPEVLDDTNPLKANYPGIASVSGWVARCIESFENCKYYTNKNSIGFVLTANMDKDKNQESKEILLDALQCKEVTDYIFAELMEFTFYLMEHRGTSRYVTCLKEVSDEIACKVLDKFRSKLKKRLPVYKVICWKPLLEDPNIVAF